MLIKNALKWGEKLKKIEKVERRMTSYIMSTLPPYAERKLRIIRFY